MSGIASVLVCDELLRLIFLELRPVYLSQEALSASTYEMVKAVKASRPQARRDLASAALVCRAFTEHALNALWEGLDSLLPIFTVLPSFPSKKRSRPSDLFSHIRPDDWALLRSYACRVKELDHQWDDLECISPCVLPIITASFYASGTPRLPRLERLRLSGLDTGMTAYTIPLLSPTLKSVSVSFDVGTDPDDPDVKDQDNFEILLSALRIACPSLQELNVSYHQWRTFHIGGRHIDSMSGFARLQRFSSRVTLNPTAWSQLGSLRALQYLDIFIRTSDERSDWDSGSPRSHSDSDSSTDPDSYSLSLPDLQSVKLTGSLNAFTTFLENLEDFLDLVKDKFPALRKFALQCHAVGQSRAGYGEGVRIDSKPLLSLLASFAELEDLSVDLGDTRFHVSDEVIAILANGLPTLVSLALQYQPSYHHIAAPRQADSNTKVLDGRPTIGALVALATSCPRLTRLHIVDINVEAETAKEVVVPTLDHKLRELEIASFRTQTQQGVFGFAEKVHRLFPRLVNMRSQDGWPAQGAVSGWNVAKAYLGFLQTV